MRTMKFRAWDKHLKMMRFFEIHEVHGESIPKDWELMQFTGYQNRQGRDIYFGDILLVGEKACEVVWDDKKGQIQCLAKDGQNMGIAGITSYGYLRGNIYENSELLK